MQLAHLWREHLEAGYPSELKGVEIAGCDVVTLDAEVTACVSAVIMRTGDTDERICRRLQEIHEALERTLDDAGEPAAGYCERLNRLVNAALLESRAERG